MVLGGTRFFGVHLVKELLKAGEQVTIATRGRASDPFGEQVGRIVVDRTDAGAMKAALAGWEFDVVYDDIAYCSNDVKAALDAVSCGRYVLVSSASVYAERMDTKEEAFDPLSWKLAWCSREDYPYDEIKRQAECALFQAYPEQNGAAVRFPYVIGPDDYTGRLRFYVEHIVRGEPMLVDNPDARIAFIDSAEAGRFLRHLGCRPETGPFNAASGGTASLREIFACVEQKTGKRPVLSEAGEEAPYNGGESFSLNTARAEAAGFAFSPLEDWLPGLLDSYLKEAADG